MVDGALLFIYWHIHRHCPGDFTDCAHPVKGGPEHHAGYPLMGECKRNKHPIIEFHCAGIYFAIFPKDQTGEMQSSLMMICRSPSLYGCASGRTD